MACVTECKLQQSSSDIYKNLGQWVRHSDAIHFTGLKRGEDEATSYPSVWKKIPDEEAAPATRRPMPQKPAPVSWRLHHPILSSSSTAEEHWTRAMLPPAATAANVISICIGVEVQQAEGDTNRDSGGSSRIPKRAMPTGAAAALLVSFVQ